MSNFNAVLPSETVNAGSALAMSAEMQAYAAGVMQSLRNARKGWDVDLTYSTGVQAGVYDANNRLQAVILNGDVYYRYEGTFADPTVGATGGGLASILDSSDGTLCIFVDSRGQTLIGGTATADNPAQMAYVQADQAAPLPPEIFQSAFHGVTGTLPPANLNVGPMPGIFYTQATDMPQAVATYMAGADSWAVSTGATLDETAINGQKTASATGVPSSTISLGGATYNYLGTFDLDPATSMGVSVAAGYVSAKGQMLFATVGADQQWIVLQPESSGPVVGADVRAQAQAQVQELQNGIPLQDPLLAYKLALGQAAQDGAVAAPGTVRNLVMNTSWRAVDPSLPAPYSPASDRVVVLNGDSYVQTSADRAVLRDGTLYSEYAYVNSKNQVLIQTVNDAGISTWAQSASSTTVLPDGAYQTAMNSLAQHNQELAQSIHEAVQKEAQKLATKNGLGVDWANNAASGIASAMMVNMIAGLAGTLAQGLETVQDKLALGAELTGLASGILSNIGGVNIGAISGEGGVRPVLGGGGAALSAVSSLINIAALGYSLSDPNLSSSDKAAIGAAIGIQAGAGAATTALEAAASMIELSAGPVGWAVGGLIGVIASVNPVAIEGVLSLADAASQYAKLAAQDAGTGYVGNQDLASFYDMASRFAAAETVPLPFVGQLIGAFETSAANGRRADANDDVVSAALANLKGSGDPLRAYFENYDMNVLMSDTQFMKTLTGTLQSIQQQLGVTRAAALETIWNPSTVRGFIEFSRTSLEAPQSTTSLINANGMSTMGVPEAQVQILQGMNYSADQYVAGDFSMSINERQPDGSTRTLQMISPNRWGSNYYQLQGPWDDVGDTGWTGSKTIAVENLSRVHYADTTIDLGANGQLEEGDSQYIMVTPELASPSDYVVYNHVAQDDIQANGDLMPSDQLRNNGWGADDSAWITQDQSWYRAWDFVTGDASTTLNMGIMATPTPYERSTIRFGSGNNTLILGNRGVIADMGVGGYDTVDYSQVQGDASSVSLVAFGNGDGTINVARTTTGGSVIVEEITAENPSWASGVSSWGAYITPTDDRKDYPSVTLQDTLSHVSAIRGSTGNNLLVNLPTGTRILGSTGSDTVRAISNPVIVDYTDQTGSVTIQATGNAADSYATLNVQKAHGADNLQGTFTILGTHYNDTFNAGATSGVTFVTNGGSDTINGGSGSNTYVLSEGNQNVYSWYGNDNIVMDGSGITGMVFGGSGADSLSFMDTADTAASSNGVLVNLASENGYAYWNGAEASVVSLSGAFRNVSGATSRDNVLIGGAYDTILQAGNANDVLVGGQANDILVAGAGTDAFVVQWQNRLNPTGPGHETDIVEVPGKNTDRVFVNGHSNLMGFARAGNDLVIGDSVTSDSIHLLNWYVSGAGHVSTLDDSDGFSINLSQMNGFLSGLTDGQGAVVPDFSSVVLPAATLCYVPDPTPPQGLTQSDPLEMQVAAVVQAMATFTGSSEGSTAGWLASSGTLDSLQQQLHALVATH